MTSWLRAPSVGSASCLGPPRNSPVASVANLNFDTPREERQTSAVAERLKAGQGPVGPFIQAQVPSTAVLTGVSPEDRGLSLPVDDFAVFRIPGSPSLSFPTTRKGSSRSPDGLRVAGGSVGVRCTWCEPLVV